MRTASAVDRISRVGDYTMLLGCIALTGIVLAGLPKLGVHKFDIHNPIARVIVQPLDGFALSEPPPAPVQKPVRAVQQASTFRQEMTMPSSELINRWNPFVAEASRRFGISEAWIKAVMRVETGGRTVQAGGRPITSHAGAMGLMQIMHGTYEEMRAQYGLGSDPFNPHDNVMAATGYLKTLYRRYGFPNMFAAYNAGPGKLQDHLENGAQLPDETVNYVANVTHTLGAPDAMEGHGRHHRNLTQYASLLPRNGRNHRNLKGYGPRIMAQLATATE